MSRQGRQTTGNVLREFFLGFIKVHILHHAGEESVYGLALIAELRRHGYELSPGTLYPVLHQLEEAGYLSRLDRVVNGKVRKYYVLTRRGGLALADAREKIAELVGEVLETGGARRRIKARKAAARRTAPEADAQGGHTNDDSTATSSRRRAESAQR